MYGIFLVYTVCMVLFLSTYYALKGSIQCVIDLEKAFDRVWHDVLWAAIKNYKIRTKVIQTIQKLFPKTQRLLN